MWNIAQNEKKHLHVCKTKWLLLVVCFNQGSALTSLEAEVDGKSASKTRADVD